MNLKKWVIKKTIEKKKNNFFTINSDNYEEDDIFFLAEEYEILNNDFSEKLLNVNNFTDTYPAYRANLKINYKNKLSAKQICEELYKSDVQSVIVEGGTKTLTTFINDGIWDEARIIQSSKTIGEGTKSPKIQGKIKSELELSNDRIKFIVSN